MIAAGDRLLLAISVENDFNQVNPGDDLEDLKSQWVDCRRIVDEFASDYVRAVERWRTAVEESAGLVPIQRKTSHRSSNLFRQFVENSIQRMGYRQ